jgi:hypothetical protein
MINLVDRLDQTIARLPERRFNHLVRHAGPPLNVQREPQQVIAVRHAANAYVVRNAT